MGVNMGRHKNFKTLYQWCLENDNDNLLKNWDYEKNGDLTPHDVARCSRVKVHFKCHLCGSEYTTYLCNIRTKTGCGHCRGNEYVDVGKNGKYIVYCHLAPNGKRYIGMTKMRLCERFSPGLYFTKIFKTDIEKYGWENFQHIVLEKDLTREEASEKEIYYINYYNTLDERYGYNLCTGGIHGGTPHECSDETKIKISLALTGKKHTLEARKNMSIAHIGKKGNHVRAIYKMDMEGQIIEEYPSVKDAATKNGFSRYSLFPCLSGKRKSFKGFIWKYKEQ